MSGIVERAIESAGLGALRSARQVGRLSEDAVERLKKADLLALGALADQVRKQEVGDDVRVYIDATPAEAGPGVVLIAAGEGEATGLDLLRQVAVCRVTGPRGVSVRVDWTSCGLEIAQVALGFGANELCGRIANKRGLLIAADELSGVGKKSQRELARVAKRKEIAGYVKRAGRVPVFIEAELPGESASRVASSQDAQ
jgi:2-iminoacetate synthase ThiH